MPVDENESVEQQVEEESVVASQQALSNIYAIKWSYEALRKSC